MNIHKIEVNLLYDNKPIPISQMQSAIDEGYEGYVDYKDGNLAYRASLIKKGDYNTNLQSISVMSNSIIRRQFLNYMDESTKSNLYFNYPQDYSKEIQASTPDVIADYKASLSTAIPSLGIDCLTCIPSYGAVSKPVTYDQIFNNFRLIKNQPHINSDEVFYFINSAAVLHLDSFVFVGKSGMIVGLSIDGVNKLLSKEGFKEYLSIANYHQDHSVNHDYASSLFTIGGGIALPVLMKMKAITSVNGQLLLNQGIKDTIYTAYKTALIGGSNSIFDIIFGSNSRFFADNWDVLKNKVNSVLI